MNSGACSYELLDRALAEAGFAARHLERLTDRGDGVLILIRPHDDLPKTVLLSRLIPILTALLVRYNAAVAWPTLQMRLRAVVHAGEVHDDGNGFYGEDLDVAFRLLDSPSVKRALQGGAGITAGARGLGGDLFGRCPARLRR